MSSSFQEEVVGDKGIYSPLVVYIVDMIFDKEGKVGRGGGAEKELKIKFEIVLQLGKERLFVCLTIESL